MNLFGPTIRLNTVADQINTTEFTDEQEVRTADPNVKNLLKAINADQQEYRI